MVATPAWGWEAVVVVAEEDVLVDKVVEWAWAATQTVEWRAWHHQLHRRQSAPPTTIATLRNFAMTVMASCLPAKRAWRPKSQLAKLPKKWTML